MMEDFLEALERVGKYKLAIKYLFNEDKMCICGALDMACGYPDKGGMFYTAYFKKRFPELELFDPYNLQSYWFDDINRCETPKYKFDRINALLLMIEMCNDIIYKPIDSDGR